jgi:hypothetical protein
MKLFKWVRFTWDLDKLPFAEVKLPLHYRIGAALKEDETELRKVLSSSFLLDPAWNPAIGQVMQTIQARLDDVLKSEKPSCLALRHGTRIIGAAIMNLDGAAADQLLPGPTILMEYRNRGFGTNLLESALIWLRQSGLSRASGLALPYAPAAKFLYPKFGSAMAVAENTTLVAA